jgi:Pentapeptide repeats (8 copies)
LIGAAIVVAALLLVALLVALGLAFRWYLNPENKLSIVQRRDLVQGLASAGQALAVFLTGAVGLTGLFFTWRNTRLARESTQETLDLTRRGQITERFTQAINQLGATEGGDKSLEIRLGGIYSLERTAREDRDYHWPIMEVLTTYIRQHAPRKPDKGSSEEEISSPDPNIQAILTVIGRRSIHHREVEYGQVDLHSTDLRRADLKGADLKGANLWDANLQDANLQDANFQGANLQGAAVQRAYLKGAYLQGTKLKGAYLQGTKLLEADTSS